VTRDSSLPPAGRRGRLAPTPTGFLHVGHAQTFALAAARAGTAGLAMRIEDLDGPRCRPEYAAAALEDLRWLGLAWTEGPDLGGPRGPYVQSQRTAWYLEIWRRLEATGLIYPSPHSRRDVEEAASAPHGTLQERGLSPFPSGGVARSQEGGQSPVQERGLSPFPSEPIFPPALRPARYDRAAEPGSVAWRFRVPDGRVIEFEDGLCGTVRRTAGVDFGDFVVWRRDDLAAYELAVVADDHAMQIAEVVRGADLLTSTARQLLLFEALGWEPPAFAHTPLVCDASGRRLAKRAGGLAIRDLRAAGLSPADVLTWSPASPAPPAPAPRHTS
jgi:glutamyl-tRNA synthetase